MNKSGPSGQSQHDIDGEQGVLPHARASAAKAAVDIAKGVETAVIEAVAWAEKKVDELGKKEEGGVGPYASPATCAPSELDPIAGGVLPSMEMKKASETPKHDGPEDAAQKLQGKK